MRGVRQGALSDAPLSTGSSVLDAIPRKIEVRFGSGAETGLPRGTLFYPLATPSRRGLPAPLLLPKCTKTIKIRTYRTRRTTIDLVAQRAVGATARQADRISTPNPPAQVSRRTSRIASKTPSNYYYYYYYSYCYCYYYNYY